VIENFGWMFVLSTLGFLALAVFLGVSRFGKIRLGEDDERPEWFRYICEQARKALSLDVRLEGICLYPICNHPGWADDRHCHNGLWDYSDNHGHREIYQPLANEIRSQLPSFEFTTAQHA